jgi:hypothetical protein
MGSSVIFYTQPMLETCIINSVDSTAAGDKKYLFDQNPDTYWKATYTADYDWAIIDTQVTDNQVDAFGFRKRNTNDGFGPASQIALDHSTNNSSWTAGTLFNITGGDAPLLVQDLAAAYEDKRYYRFHFLNLDTASEISDLFLLRKYTISRGAEMPIQDDIEYANVEADLIGNRKLVRAQFRKPVTHYSRKYLISGTTMKGYIDSIIADCRGTLYPFIIQEGTTLAEMQYCRFDSVPIIIEKAYQFYEVTMEFSSIPYIQDGYAY